LPQVRLSGQQMCKKEASEAPNWKSGSLCARDERSKA
jgi:hypothetical protein